MASCSSRLAFTTLALLALPGCWTTHLMEHGRTREIVLSYEAASVDGQFLRLDYTVGGIDDGTQPKEVRRRSAIIALDDLVADPEHPVDAFPMKRVRPGQRAAGETALELVEANGRAALTGADPAEVTSIIMEIDAENGRHTGFRLCPDLRATCPAHFHSDALTRDRLSWWVYPVAPVALGVDMVLLPLQLTTLPAMLVLSD
jgi:hypothetical protein